MLRTKEVVVGYTREFSQYVPVGSLLEPLRSEGDWMVCRVMMPGRQPVEYRISSTEIARYTKRVRPTQLGFPEIAEKQEIAEAAPIPEHLKSAGRASR